MTKEERTTYRELVRLHSEAVSEGHTALVQAIETVLLAIEAQHPGVF